MQKGLSAARVTLRAAIRLVNLADFYINDVLGDLSNCSIDLELFRKMLLDSIVYLLN